MANGLRRTLDRLRTALSPELPDEHLLKEFISGGDETVFATLVRRHGQMVLGVSKRILGNLHDSEDVFQATFLVLAQKAHSVINREALSSWLYKVAYRISLKAKTRNDRRRRKERQMDVLPHPQSSAPVVQDWEALLDEELNRLPDKYRQPVILCDLEGRTRKEVERQLHLPPGTLSSRLTIARRMLAEKLSRRGVALSGGALAMAMSQATAAVPPALVGATANKAVLVAAGQLAAISSSVTILMKAGVKAMFLAKLKATVATVTVLAILGVGGFVYSGGGQTKQPSELEALRKENELLKVNLRVTLEKIQTLEKEVASLKGQKKTGTTLFEEIREGKQVTEGQVLNGLDWIAVASRLKKTGELKEEHEKRVRQLQELDSVLKDLMKANAPEARQRAIDILDRMLKMLQQPEKKDQSNGQPPSKR
jgi:RNA polymerase sigma factor (sigma-70 family)